MRILLIDVNCKNSSTGKIVYDLYTDLNNKKHEAAICYGRGPVVAEDNIFKFGMDIETYFHAFMTRITGLTGVYSPVSTRRLIDFIDRFQPDVVHIHELHAYFINIAPIMNYLKLKNITTVWTFHCEFMYTGKCGNARECENWKTQCHNCPQVQEYPKSLWFDFTRKMFNRKKELFSDFDNLTIVTPSHWLRDRVRVSFLKDKEIRVVHNGIDTENIFYPRKYNHLKEKHGLGDEKIILTVAPNLMSDAKGGKWVIQLARLLQSEKVKFILIGVEDLTKNYGDNVIPLGRITNQTELAEYYSMADITLLTSIIETFSLVSAESLACGTPVLGFESGAPKEIAPEGYGRFVDYGDMESLTKEARRFLNGESDLKSKSKCAKYGKEKYSKGVMVQNYLNIFQK